MMEHCIYQVQSYRILLFGTLPVEGKVPNINYIINMREYTHACSAYMLSAATRVEYRVAYRVEPYDVKTGVCKTIKGVHNKLLTRVARTKVNKFKQKLKQSFIYLFKRRDFINFTDGNEPKNT